MTRRTLVLAYAIICVIAVIRVANTHRIFAAVLDEPVHLICGYDWLHGKPYVADPTHPPLARILAALPATLQHLGPFHGDVIERGYSLVYANEHYQQNVAAARRPLLIFIVVGVVATGLWTARYFGDLAGLIAAAFFSTLPPLLGSAGLVTTDFALAAFLPLAWLLLERFLEHPTNRRALAAGVAIAAAALSKFSFLLFFPIGAVILAVAALRRTHVRPRVAHVAIICVTAFVLVWGMYRFQIATLRDSIDGAVATAEVFLPKSMLHTGLWIDAHVPLPAPLYVVGAGMVQLHNRLGHEAFLLGRTSKMGFWDYFPVVFFYKTPLPFLALALIGIVLIATRRRDALPLALIPIALMLAVLPSHINIGVRHILPIYPPLCGVGAYATMVMWREVSTRAGTAALLAWLFAGVALAHPDYLAWFNEAAGEHPEVIALDSNLDWGQDALRLVQACRRHHIDLLKVAYNGSLMLFMHNVRAEVAQPFTPAPGWYAISYMSLAFDPDAKRGGFRWLDDYRYEMVGKSIRLYHVPELPVIPALKTNAAATTSDAAPRR